VLKKIVKKMIALVIIGIRNLRLKSKKKLLTPKSLSGYHKTGGVTNE